MNSIQRYRVSHHQHINKDRVLTLFNKQSENIRRIVSTQNRDTFNDTYFLFSLRKLLVGA